MRTFVAELTDSSSASVSLPNKVALAEGRRHVVERQSREFCATILLTRLPVRSSIGSSLQHETGEMFYGI